MMTNQNVFSRAIGPDVPFMQLQIPVVVFCVVRPCNVVVGHQSFGGPFYHHLQVF